MVGLYETNAVSMPRGDEVGASAPQLGDPMLPRKAAR